MQTFRRMMWSMPYIIWLNLLLRFVIWQWYVWFVGLNFSFSSVRTVGVDGLRQRVRQRWYLMNPFVFIIKWSVLRIDCFSFVCAEFECVFSRRWLFGCRQIIVEYWLIANCVGVTIMSVHVVTYVFDLVCGTNGRSRILCTHCVLKVPTFLMI